MDTLSPTPDNQPAEEGTEKPASEPTDELGPIIVLKRAPRYQPIHVFSDSQYLYNSNVLLTPSNEHADEVFAETLGANFSPRLINGLASTVFVRQQFIRYSNLGRFNFATQAAGLSLQYPVRNWFILSGGFEADRYFAEKDDDEFLKDFDLSFGIRRGQYLHQRVFLYYGYQFNWLPSSPSNLSSLNNAVYAGVNLALLEQLTFMLAGRVRGLAYYQNSQFDLTYSLNASLIYKFNNYVNVRAFVSYAKNDSDNATSDYEGLTAGGGLGLTLGF
jgi:hypothetical protein